MEDDDSSVELVYEDPVITPIVKDEEEKHEKIVVEDEDIDEETVAVIAEEDECVVIEENENYQQDKDPMDLLELLETKTAEEGAVSKNGTDNEETESVVSSEPDERLTRRTNMMAEYEWCFVEIENKNAWCLYCNTFLKNPSIYHLRKHQNSNMHKERTQEYLKFLNQLNKDRHWLSSNRGFEGNIRDAIDQRQSLEEDFSNHLWDKWEDTHDWLVRTDTRFVAYCKYCQQKLSVSNGYLRKSHEEGTKHKEYRSKAPKRRATLCADLQSFQAENRASEMEQQESEAENVDIGESNSKWYEKSKTSSDLCRCKLCDITLFQKSFPKHISSNLHRQNLSALDSPGVSDKFIRPDWVAIQKDHEWIMEDPTNPMEAYCKYCKKRLGYGTSVAKRLIHEHSSAHRLAVQNFNKELSKEGSPSEEDNEVESNENTEDDNGDMKEEEQEVKSIGENSNEGEEPRGKKRGRKPGKKSIVEGFPWAKLYKKDSRFIICQYCKVLLRKESFYGKKHEKALRHQQGEKLYLDKLGTKLALKHQSEKPKRANETFFPWLVKFKNGIDYVFCKYCNFRFSRKANRLNHQNTHRHQEAEKALLKEKAESEFQTPVKTASSAKNDHKERKSPMATQAELRVMKSKIMEWQKRFTWLRFDKGLLLNYGFCNYCDKSVFMPSPAFASKHQRSSPHIRARWEMKKQVTQAESITDPIETAGEDESEDSSTSSCDKRFKRVKANSLKTAIETAKRLSAAHLEMMTFMRNNGQQKIDITKTMQLLSGVQENSIVKQVPPPPASPSIDSNIATPINRDPFDLFFNSISETLKRLPADLASEGKLKVMQTIFDLEIRAQQRQNQTEVMSTPNTSLIRSALNTTNENSLNKTHDKTEDIIPETVYIDETTESNHQQQQQQQNQQIQQQSQQVQQQARPNIYKAPVNNNTQPRSLLQQQLSQPHQPPQAPNPRTFTSQSGQLNPSPVRLNPSPHRQRNSNIGGSQIQRDTSQNVQPTYSQYRAANQMNMNNFSHRMNANNTSISYSNSTPTSTSTLKRHLTSNHVSLMNNIPNNNGTPPNKLPMIRPVPINSLKYYDEPPFHHIQLNSSTQSKIIPLDTNKGITR